MTDQEINERLALAIGWPCTYTLHDGTVYVHAHTNDVFKFGHIWISGRVFDYRDPAVIWPIAERFDCFPFLWDTRDVPNKWGANIPEAPFGVAQAATAAKAVALAVITARLRP